MSGNRTLNTLELFAGSATFTEVAKKMGMNTFCSDIQDFDNIDYPIDILKFKHEMVPFIPDIIWASPCCEKWSLAGGRKGGNLYWESIKENGKLVGIKPRCNFNINGLKKTPDEIDLERKLHVEILEKTIDIINYYKKLNPNLIYFIENPVFGYMRIYLGDRIKYVNTVTYCQYGFDYRKETNIFSNIKLDLKSCKKRDKCHSDNFYSGGSVLRQINRKSSVNSYYDKSLIPDMLCKTVLEQCISKLI